MSQATTSQADLYIYACLNCAWAAVNDTAPELYPPCPSCSCTMSAFMHSPHVLFWLPQWIDQERLDQLVAEFRLNNDSS
jgi:hypothetical protein